MQTQRKKKEIAMRAKLINSLWFEQSRVVSVDCRLLALMHSKPMYYSFSPHHKGSACLLIARLSPNC